MSKKPRKKRARSKVPSATSRPELIGVIDIGSNIIRLAIGEVHEDRRMEVLERARLPVPIGRDTFLRGRLTRRVMNAAIDVLRGYKNMLNEYGVSHIRAIATSAVREASNAEAFCDRVFMTTGLEVEIIPSAEESQLLVTALRLAAGSAIGAGYSLIIEVGGGSALLSILHRGEIVSSDSYALGSIRLLETLDITGQSPARAASLVRHQVSSIVSAMSASIPLKRVRTFIALGGDARFAARHAGKRVGKKSLWSITPDQFDRLVAQCEKLKPEQLTGEYKLPFAEAETLTPALLVYQAVFAATSARRITVSDVSLRDGLLLDLAGWAAGQPDEQLTNSMINSAESMAQKYRCDMNHARHVARLSLRLFDELEADHGLSARHRLLLHLAALLHEVGGYVSGRGHHKHSYYIIANSELFGLRTDELEIVANTARYHRGNTPRASHETFVALQREQRVIVSKLAAILRLADALERGHSQQVSDFVLRRTEDEVIIRVAGATDLALERMALKRKSDLLADIFGLRVRLEEA